MSMQQAQDRQTSAAEEALLGLVRLTRALAFYPPGHASRQMAADDARKRFAEALRSGEPLVVTVRRHQMRLGDDGPPMDCERPALGRLCAAFFDRRVRSLVFLPDLPDEELAALAACLALDPDEVQRRGGVGAVLASAKIGAIGVNETDISALLRRREELRQAQLSDAPQEGGEPEAPEPTSLPASVDVQALIAHLKEEEPSDDFARRLKALADYIRGHLQVEHRRDVLYAVEFLALRSGAGDIAQTHRELIRKTVRELGAAQVLRFFVLLLSASETDEASRDRAGRLLLFYRQASIPPLMEHLIEGAQEPGRRSAVKILVHLGRNGALPALLPYLDDERWQMVREAAALLGQMRIPETAAHLEKIAHHPDLRVRREAIRALTRIGGDEALRLLLDSLQRGEDALRLQILLSLGALRDPGATPALIRLVESPDRWMQQSEIRKGAIRALGEIGAPEAIPVLLKILNARRLWRRKRVDELRAAAAAALGAIATQESLEALSRATDDPSAVVARAAAQALKNYRMQGHESKSR